MNSNWTEEKKASIDGVEIPIQCIMMENKGMRPFPPPHYHDYVEILYGIDGHAEIWANGKMFVLGPETMLVINSKFAHTVRSFNGETAHYIVIKYMPQVLYAAQQSIFEFKYVVPFMLDNSSFTCFFDSKELSGTEIPRIMKQTLDEWEKKSYGYEIALRIYVLKISLWLVRYWESETNIDNNVFKAEAEYMHTIAGSMEYAQKFYPTATASDAAKHVGLSYSYFSRLFKKLMGKSFSEYLSYIRISEAKRLLTCTDKDITEIAMDTGFATSSYFIDKFKKNEGITPKQFRMISSIE